MANRIARIGLYALRWFVTLCAVLTVAELSLEPGVTESGDSVFSWLVVNTAPLLQNVMHVVVYAALAMLWVWTLGHVNSRRIRAWSAVTLTTGIGVVLEVAQTGIPGRFGNFLDVVLNAFGAVIGVLAVRWIFWRRSAAPLDA